MLANDSILSLHKQLKEKRLSPGELLTECFTAIDKFNPVVNAFITQTDRDQLTKTAATLTINHPLSGIPYVLKDAYVTSDLTTTAASTVLANYRPQYDATVYTKLKSAGALILGKTNMDAWGHGASTENTDFGPTKNPWNYSHVAGGSSGGAGAAVASGMSMFAIGEDTGGSIRNPAGWCGISGLKVTYGRVSRYGAIAYASSLDTVGPMAKSVEDLAVILGCIAGLDPYDATSSPLSVPDYLRHLHQGVKGKIIGLPKEFLGSGIDPEVKNLLLAAAHKFADLGAKINDQVSLPLLPYGVAVYYVLAPSETSSNLARYDGVRFGSDRSRFTFESTRRIMIGTYALSSGYYDAYYKHSQQARTLIISDYAKAFASCDFLLGPISPSPATKFGELISDPVKNMLADVYTVTTNTAGIPALALPCGFSSSGLPVGMQLQGPMFSEDLLLQAGFAYQQVTDFHHARPPLT